MSPVVNPNEVEAWQIHDGVAAKLLAKGQNMTGLWSRWEPNSNFAVHTHPHEQIGVCLQGEAIFTIDGQEYLVKQGDVYHIPPDVPHAERNEKDVPAVFFECFAPVREDLLRRRFEAKIYEK